MIIQQSLDHLGSITHGITNVNDHELILVYMQKPNHLQPRDASCRNHRFLTMLLIDDNNVGAQDATQGTELGTDG